MRLYIFSLLVLLVVGCDQLGIETPDKANVRQEAEGKAIGAACRHVGRSIEDCYNLNTSAKKSAVFDGWKEMNDYMRENKIETVTPTATTAESVSRPKRGEARDNLDVSKAFAKETEARTIERNKSRDSYVPVEGEYVPPIPKSKQKSSTK